MHHTMTRVRLMLLPGTLFTLDNAAAIVKTAFSSMKIMSPDLFGWRNVPAGLDCDLFLFTVESMIEADFKNGESSSAS
jgi:hypothetical protein